MQELQEIQNIRILMLLTETVYRCGNMFPDYKNLVKLVNDKLIENISKL